MKLSVVSTLYMSGDTLHEFYKQTSAVAEQLVGDSFELVLVNDGSPDSSGAIAEKISKSDSRVLLLNLSRNFGHHHAIMAGLSQSRGDLIFLIDSDLEEDPFLLIDFYDKLQSESLDAVYGVQKKRKGLWFERASGGFFYSLFNAISEIKIPRNLSTVRLMTRSYVNSLLKFTESEVFLGGIWQAVGYNQAGVEFVKRSQGRSSYSFRKKIKLAAISVASFSNAPLVWLFGFGSFLSIGSFLYVVFLVFNWALLGRPPSGWTSVLASIWLLGSLTLLSLGILGLYLSTIFSEVKKRPNFIIKNPVSDKRAHPS